MEKQNRNMNRLEFGNPTHIQRLKMDIEKQDRIENGKPYRVKIQFSGSYETRVWARSEQEASDTEIDMFDLNDVYMDDFKVCVEELPRRRVVTLKDGFLFEIPELPKYFPRKWFYDCPYPDCRCELATAVPVAGEDQFDTMVVCPECGKMHFRVVKRSHMIMRYRTDSGEFTDKQIYFVGGKDEKEN